MFDNKKLRQNADLVVPFTSCPFGKPINECPFIPYYELNNEREQIKQIIEIPQGKLEELRKFHRSCMQELAKTRKVKL